MGQLCSCCTFPLSFKGHRYRPGSVSLLFKEFFFVILLKDGSRTSTSDQILDSALPYKPLPASGYRDSLKLKGHPNGSLIKRPFWIYWLARCIVIHSILSLSLRPPVLTQYRLIQTGYGAAIFGLLATTLSFQPINQVGIYTKVSNRAYEQESEYFKSTPPEMDTDLLLNEVVVSVHGSLNGD